MAIVIHCTSKVAPLLDRVFMHVEERDVLGPFPAYCIVIRPAHQEAEIHCMLMLVDACRRYRISTDRVHLRRRQSDARMRCTAFEKPRHHSE